MNTSTLHQSLRLEVRETGIASIWLDGSGKSVVVLDRNLIGRLHATLDQLEAMDGVKGLMLRSDCQRVFVAGADLAEIDSLDDHGLHAYLAYGTTVFGRIASLPYPSVAVINGAALGGGLEIAMHCDGLIASRTNSKGKPFPIGLPEAGLGLCPGWGGTQLLPARINPKAAIEMTATGKPCMSDSLPDGLIDVLVESPKELEAAGVSWLQSQGNRSSSPLKSISTIDSKKCAEALSCAREEIETTDAATAVFNAVETGIDGGWAAAIATEQCELVTLRHTTTAREKLDAFLSKG